MSQKKHKRPPIHEPARVENDLNQRIVDLATRMTPEEFFELSVKVGVHKRDGALTAEYGGDVPKSSKLAYP